jgi:hypothetical protein
MQERFTARLRAKLRARVKVRQDAVNVYTVEKRIAYEEKKQYLNETGSGMLSIPFNRTLITASHYLALLLFTAPPNPTHPRAVPRSKYAQDPKAKESTPSVREPTRTENAMSRT